MSALKIAGFLTLVAGVACLAFVPRFLENQAEVAGVPIYAVALGAIGLFLAVLGLVFLMRSPPSEAPSTPPPAPAAAAEPITIKRTQMDWGGNVADGPDDADTEEAAAPATDALDDVHRRMGKLKVDYGLGKLGANAYHELMRELEAEEAAILSNRRTEGRA